MRVACVSHGSIVALNRRPFDLLAERHAVALTVIVPERWPGDLPDPDIRFEPAAGGATSVALPARAAGNGTLFTLRGLGRAIVAARPDLVLLDEEPWSLVAWQTLRAAPPVPLVVYSKQNLAKRLPPPFRWIRGACYRRATRAWAVGATTAEVLRATGFQRPVDVIPHGVEVTRFQPGRDEARRAALGLRGVVIGYAGRFVAEKGLDDLLEAARRLPGDIPFTVVLVGSGPREAALRRAAAEGPLAGRLVVLPAVPHEEAPGLYRLMDVFVLPSRSTPRWREQFGRALVESAATAVPVVAYDSGEIPNVMRALGCGTLVREGDVAGLADAIAAFVADEGRRRTVGQAGLAAARAGFAQEAIADRMAAALRLAAGS